MTHLRALNRTATMWRQATGSRGRWAALATSLSMSSALAGSASFKSYCSDTATTDTQPGPARIIVRDADEFSRKWSKFSKDGMDKLLVMADFDYTLTKVNTPAGERAESSHGVLLHAMSKQSATDAWNTFLHYYPIEQSTTLSKEEKLPHMLTWWNKQHAFILQNDLTRQDVLDAGKKSNVTFREGFDDVFNTLTAFNVPTLIFSAGLYDVIHALLDLHYGPNATPSNVHVISNMMKFDTDGVAREFQGEIIHSLNKNAEVLAGSSFLEQCHADERSNVLILGDSIGDADMAHGLDEDKHEMLKIGFVNDGGQEKVEQYLTKYDVVLTNDASLHLLILLLSQMQK